VVTDEGTVSEIKNYGDIIMILKRKLFTLIFSCLTLCTLNNCMEVNNAESASEMLEIETSDGCKHTVAKELCLLSEVICNMLEDLKDCDGGSQISLPGLSSDALQSLLPMLQLIQRQEELANQLNLKSLQELAELLRVSNYLDIEQLLEAVSTCISAQLCVPEARQQFCNNRDFLRSIGLAELPKELSVLLGSKIAKHSDLRAYLLNNCSISYKVLKGHIVLVRSAEFNNSGDKIVSASYDGTVRILDVESGECLRVFEGHTGSVNSAEFNKAGDKIVSASYDRTARIWDVESGECLRVLEGHTGWGDSAKFNNSGDKVVSASYDGTIRIWDVSELNAIDCYLQRDLTLEQALFLSCAYEAKQNGQLLDCKNCPWLLEYYNSLPDCIQRILIKTNAVFVSFSLRRLVGNATEFVNQHGTSMIAGASAVGLAGWLLMKELSRK